MITGSIPATGSILFLACVTLGDAANSGKLVDHARNGSFNDVACHNSLAQHNLRATNHENASRQTRYHQFVKSVTDETTTQTMLSPSRSSFFPNAGAPGVVRGDEPDSLVLVAKTGRL
jgi:hypothetical protein